MDYSRLFIISMCAFKKRVLNNTLLASTAALLLLTGNFIAKKSYKDKYPPITELQSNYFTATCDIAAFSLGARRLSADIWFIRLLIYYGTEEVGNNKEFGDGEYAAFYPRAIHIARLDPYFSSANLYSSAALAFNLFRYEEAENLLKYALKYHENEWFYTQMLLSIAHTKKNDVQGIIDSILPILDKKDCPPMIKNITAVLYRRTGQYQKAAELYVNIIKTSKEEEYVEKAINGLKEVNDILSGKGNHDKALTDIR